MLTKMQIRNLAKQAVANCGPYIIYDSGAESYFQSIGEWEKFSDEEQYAISIEANKQADRVLDFLGM